MSESVLTWIYDTIIWRCGHLSSVPHRAWPDRIHGEYAHIYLGTYCGRYLHIYRVAEECQSCSDRQ